MSQPVPANSTATPDNPVENKDNVVCDLCGRSVLKKNIAAHQKSKICLDHVKQTVDDKKPEGGVLKKALDDLNSKMDYVIEILQNLETDLFEDEVV